jgi:8-oxo-dGTP diphosphatase
MARKTIQAAGGIVVRDGARRRIAVVQRSKDDRWVLPRGKLERDENPAVGARREAVEETGHRVKVYEFLGAITYRASGRPKVVQFWRMKAAERPSRDVMKDIVAVEWLPLAAAVRRLSYPLEKLFLRHVGRRMLKRRRRKPARASARLSLPGGPPRGSSPRAAQGSACPP